jgi:hypothetical protein
MTSIENLTLKVKDQSYLVKFPNNGQYRMIQNLKTSLSPYYDNLSGLGEEGEYTKALVDMEAHYVVLCPDLIKNLAKPLFELSMIETRELLETYTNQFRPWFQECMSFVFSSCEE